MSWTFEQCTGKMFAPDGSLTGQGYSGGGTDPGNLEAIKGKNNPAMQKVHNEGPLPAGWYTMQGPINSHTHGPYAIPLLPDISNVMYGRDAFLCHGDSVVHPGFASEGCIIQDHLTRVKMWESGDHRLNVISSEASFWPNA